jgi:hypothetical protein
MTGLPSGAELVTYLDGLEPCSRVGDLPPPGASGYVREDELLSDLAALLPGNDGDLRQVAARLRTEEITIVCDRQDRRLSRDLT